MKKIDLLIIAAIVIAGIALFYEGRLSGMYLSLISAGVVISLIVIKFLIKRYGQSESFAKGDAGEQRVVEMLNGWSQERGFISMAYKCPVEKIQSIYHQHIDILCDSPDFINLGIEVKYRTTDQIEFLHFDSISKFDSSGARQTTRQLFDFISNTGRLGLYAFILKDKSGTNVYFLPHFVLQQMIDTGKYYITIKKIKTHSLSYQWEDGNKDFHQYAENQYQLQKRYLSSVGNPIEEEN